MNENSSARRYARALLETARDARTVRDELSAITDVLKANPALFEAFANPAVPPATKKSIFSAVFQDATAPLPRLFEMLIDDARIELAPLIAARYREEWNARNNVHAARVVSAMPLDAEATDGIRKAIETAVSGEVEMQTAVDPALMGGLKVEVDGYLFDGSVKARLTALRRHLL